MNIHEFYRRHGLRVHEIPRGIKRPIATGWPDSNRPYDDVDDRLQSEEYNKYGWILDNTHVVIDIDVHHPDANGYESLAKLEAAIGFELANVCGAIVETPSGGRHYYFTKPANATFGKTFTKIYPGIDFICGKGKQVIAAGSAHDTYPGKIYEINKDPDLFEIPFDLLEHLQSIREKTAPATVLTASNQFVWKPASIGGTQRSGDEFNKSDNGLLLLLSILESRGYSLRHRGDFYEFDRPGKTTDSGCSGHVGKQSRQGNYQLTCFSLSDPNFPSGEAMTIFNAYALLCHDGDHKETANDLYGKGFAEELYPGVDISGILNQMPSLAAKQIGLVEDVPDDEEFFAAMLPREGLLRDIFDYYWTRAYKRANAFGLSVAVSICETIFGRRIQSHTELRTNDYNLIVAVTSSGKDACEKIAQEILKKAFFASKINSPGFLLAPGMQSGNALMREISDLKCGLWICDEFGKHLETILDKKSNNQHAKKIGSNLLQLYGASNKDYEGDSHSEGRRNSITQPHLCLLGMSTFDVFDFLGASQVHDGLFGRMTFWPVAYRPKRSRGQKVVAPPEHMIEQIAAWMRFQPGLQGVYPDPVTIDMTPLAKSRWETHVDDIDDRMDGESELRAAVWARTGARSMKFALVHRAARFCGNPEELKDAPIEIEEQDIDWGIRLSNWFARLSCALVAETVVDKKSNDAQIKILESIRDSETGEVRHSWLVRRFRTITSGDFAAGAKELASSGHITIRNDKPTGKPGRDQFVYLRAGSDV